jgi:hypothetical protein
VAGVSYVSDTIPCEQPAAPFEAAVVFAFLGSWLKEGDSTQMQNGLLPQADSDVNETQGGGRQEAGLT